MNEEQRKFAAEVNVAVLATVDSKGRPHATPIWYMLDGDELGRGGEEAVVDAVGEEREQAVGGGGFAAEIVR